MASSIGLIELKSVPAGIQCADEMLKAAAVGLLTASPGCPGKYIIAVSGQVGAVKSAMKAGISAAGTYIISEHVINNVHPDIAPAIVGLTEVGKIAEQKMPDLNCTSVESAMAMIAGTCRSMGVLVAAE